jgi:pyridoxamine 5'-phosphate oxidase-like protein
MASWSQIEASEPEFAADAKGLMDLRVHKTMATLRPDGSPRISGIEARFVDGELAMGSMPNSPKVRDLAADPRFALHSGSEEPDGWAGDAKFAGTVVEVSDPDIKRAYVAAAGTAPPGDYHLYKTDITEVVVIRLGDPADHLVVRRWTPERGVRVSELR